MTITAVEGAIEQARSTIESGLTSNEIHTRYFVIDPIIRALGWDTGDPNQIRYEYPLRTEGGVDYALFNPLRQPVILIEAKDLRRDAKEHAPQLACYLGKIHARGESPSVGVLTDGRNWYLYDLKQPGSLESAPTESIDICEGDANGSAWRLLHWLDNAKWW